MLLQLENTNADGLKKLIAFAEQNNLKLSLLDESADDYILPGKPLTEEQLIQLIESSRKSGTISMMDAFLSIRKNYGD